MRMRPYNKSQDFEHIQKWVSDERTHALWCAKLLPYPFTSEDFHSFLAQGEKDWGDCGYIFMDDVGTPVGFCIVNINVAENFGFVKFVVLDSELRGQGYGTRMMKLLLKYAYEIMGVGEVRINVFDCNIGAKKCYEKVGFTECSFAENVLQFGDECWGRYQLAAEKMQ